MSTQRPASDRDWFIYTLQLKHNCWYVGRTRNPEVRIDDHNNGAGSEWTRLHAPVAVASIVPDCTRFDEDSAVIELMNEKGIQLVRGGIYSAPVLSNEDIFQITKLIHGANDCCYVCGKPGHFARNCRTRQPRTRPAKSASSSSSSSASASTSSAPIVPTAIIDLTEEPDSLDISFVSCTRCGYTSHNADACYAHRHRSGRELPPLPAPPPGAPGAPTRNRCGRCNRTSHDALHCRALTYENGQHIT